MDFIELNNMLAQTQNLKNGFNKLLETDEKNICQLKNR